MHIRNKERKKKHLFYFPHSSAVQKMKIQGKKTAKKNNKTINRLPLLYISVFMYIHVYVYHEGSLHEHTALGPVLPHGRGLVHLLSPTWQGRQGELWDPLQASAGTATFQLLLVRPLHRRHRGDVEHISNAVLWNLGRTLYVGHRSDLSSYRTALEH